MIYDIKLRLAFDYANPAAHARHLACVLPKEIAQRQRLHSASLQLVPAPDERLDRQDFFGNQLTEFCFRSPHEHLVLTLHARVEIQTAPTPAQSPPLAALTPLLAGHRDLGADSPLHFQTASPRVPLDPAMAAFARTLLRADISASDAVLAIGRGLHRHMRFDPQATKVDTPAVEAFALRRGVCQDFSHVMIACLRSLGIPAGYVSGYLRTAPPPGKARLEGADAMHAWVRAWCGPETGWLEFDPTNDCLAGSDHIVAAYGRDYSDVAPIRGALRLSGKQEGHQSVDVIPLLPDEGPAI